MTDGKIATQDTMRERADESRVKLWLLLGANRLVVTGVLSGLLFGVFMLGAFVEPPLSEMLDERAVIEGLFTAMIGALITGVTLVVTISQLVVSQKNDPLGEQRDRMSATMDFREYVRELLDEPAPADPSTFLRRLVGTSSDRAEVLRESVEDAGDPDLREEVDEFVNSLTSNADTVTDQLDGARFGTYDVLGAALNYNYSWKVFQTERLEDDHADALDDEAREALAELRRSLVMYGPAREHVKTLYFQWELIDLSRLILYLAVPAVVVAGMMLAFVDASTFPGSTLGIEDLLWVVAAAFIVTLLPFLLLTAYVLRIATMAKRTLAIGPLILRDSQR